MKLLKFLQKPKINPTRGFLEVGKPFKKFEQDTLSPIRADKGSAGYDFYSKESVAIKPGQKHLFWTDVKAFMKQNEVLEIYIRSSLGIKYDLVLSNTVGIIDSSYFENPTNDGNIGISLKNTGAHPVHIDEGDRIAQGIFKEYLTTVADNVKDEERFGGFGHSGK